MSKFIGTAQNDTYSGTERTDTIVGYKGNDVLLGAGGNDYLYGGDGDDYMAGGKGNDFIHSGGGNDVLKGDDGDDIFVFHDYGGTKTVKDFTREEGGEMDKILLVGDAEFSWTQTGIGEVTVEYGDTTIIFENVSGREFSYDDIFI